MLIHGFASSLQGNWRAPGIVDAIVKAGRQVIAIDCRGHGRSGKPHDPAAYAGSAMADDAVAVLDHLHIDKADLAGYSMGGFLSTTLLVNRPERWRSVIISGMGDVLLKGNLPSQQFDTLVAAMEAPDAASIKDARGRAFRQFARSERQRSARARRDAQDPAHRLRSGEARCREDSGAGADRRQGRPGEREAPRRRDSRRIVRAKCPGDHLGAVATPQFSKRDRRVADALTIKHWDGPPLDAWRAWRPEQAAEHLAGVGIDWCVVGGWAIDLWLGRETRPHEDLEIAILRDDFAAIRTHLSGFDLHSVGDGEVRRLAPTTMPPADKHQNWVLDPRGERVADGHHDGIRRRANVGVSTRSVDPRAAQPDDRHARRRAVPETGRRAAVQGESGTGKGRSAISRPVCRVLDDAARAWLAEALARAHPDHPWIATLFGPLAV